jgi:hypothetical protein
MALDLEMLLSPDDELAQPEKRAAMAAALRKQQAMGTLGQLMGVAPTVRAGESMQQGAEQSLRLALAKQQAAKEAAARASERQQAQGNWQADQTRQAARDAEQQRQFGIQETRLGRSQDAEAKRQWAHAVDPITGQMRLYNQITGEWRDSEAAPQGAAPQGAAPQGEGFGSMPPGVRLTDTQEKSRTFAQRMTKDVQQIEQLLAGGYTPSFRDYSLKMGTSDRPLLAGFAEKGMSPEGRQFFNSASRLVNAILRKESGAAITDAEWARAFADWLPRPTDSPEEQSRKAAALRAEMESMAMGAGPGARYWQSPPMGSPERVNAPGQSAAAGVEKYFEGP